MSNCPKLNRNNVNANRDVVITWPAQSTNTASTSAEAKDNAEDFIIFAYLPSFTAEKTGKYIFEVSLDKAIPEDSKLIFLNASEDLQGIFTIPDAESFDHVIVSANFEAGKTYSPVIAAKSETGSNGGGCHIGLYGIMFSFVGFAMIKRR